MPTFNEIAQGYALKIRRAIIDDGFRRSASVTTAGIRGSRVLRAFKEISSDLDRYTIDDEPLTEEQRKRVLALAGKSLDLDEPEDFYWSTRAGSNDAYMQM